MSASRVFPSPRQGAAAAALLASTLAGCNPAVQVREPTSARPEPPVVAARREGAIFNDATYRPLFEDRRARFVGDTLTIQLNERLNASKKGASNAERTASLSAAAAVTNIPIIDKLNGRSVEASSANKFSGKGETEASNLFLGTITVTVIDVQPNGNLVVSGEKQIGITNNVERLRISGVVNPINILPGNVVSSAQIADARIDYRSAGYIDESQMMGWLARFFMVLTPF